MRREETGPTGTRILSTQVPLTRSVVLALHVTDFQKFSLVIQIRLDITTVMPD